jgi:hypothetical protein
MTGERSACRSRRAHFADRSQPSLATIFSKRIGSPFLSDADDRGKPITDRKEAYYGLTRSASILASLQNRYADREANNRGNRLRKGPQSVLGTKRPNPVVASLPPGIEPLFLRGRTPDHTDPVIRFTISIVWEANFHAIIARNDH